MENGKPGAPDALESYPAAVLVKAVGEATADFRDAVVAIVARHAGVVADEAVHVRPSRKGRYVSVTVHFTAETRQQVDAVVRALGEDERVRFVL